MKFHLALAALLLMGAATAQEYSARYRVTFSGQWSGSSHPGSFPNNAHFSPLVGLTHDAQGQIWQPGELASAGIERMAETGGTGTLNSEIDSLIVQGLAESRLNDAGANAEGTVVFEFEISESHPQVSLVTMIAPSPDWFVGIHGVDLREDGIWSAERVIELLPYDSGTDSGTAFTSANQDTSPAELISRLDTEPFPNAVPLASLRFERLSSEGVPTGHSISGQHSGTWIIDGQLDQGLFMNVGDASGQPFVFVSWFTFMNGEPFWLAGNQVFNDGDGQIEITLQSLQGPEFLDDSGVPASREPFGTLSLTAAGCDSFLADYDFGINGAGSVVLDRLTNTLGHACGE